EPLVSKQKQSSDSWKRLRHVTNGRDRTRIEKTGKYEAIGNSAFVAGAIYLFGDISVEAIRRGRAFVNVPQVRRIAQCPQDPRNTDFMDSEGSKGWDLPITAYVPFELRSELCESRTDAICLLERISGNRNKALVAGGFDPKQD